MPPKKNLFSKLSTAQPNTSASTSTASASSDETAMAAGTTTAAIMEILVEVRTGRAELADAMSQMNQNLEALKTELGASITAVKTDVDELRATVSEMEVSLSTYTDQTVSTNAEVAQLKAQLAKSEQQLASLDNKCEAMEARARRNNIRIIGLSEDSHVDTATISVMLKDAFELEREPPVQEAYRFPQAKPRPGERPRPVVVRLSNFSDCAEILKRARIQRRIEIMNSTIQVFPDLTPRTAKARAAFNDVRRRLKEIPNVRFGLLYPARLRITHGNVTKDFTSPDEAAAFVDTLK